MRQLLVPIDPANESRTRSAIAEVVRLYRQEPVAIHLLRVQPRLTSHVAMFFGPGELHALQQQAGAEDLRFACSLLDAAGVRYEASVLVGRSAETIARAAREHRCDRIVFGDSTSLAAKMFGSLAQQVRHLLDPTEAQVIGS